MRSSHHRNHHARRLLCLTALACFVVGGTAYACTRKAAVPQLPELPAESLAQPAENGTQQSLLTAAQAQALLVLVLLIDLAARLAKTKLKQKQ